MKLKFTYKIQFMKFTVLKFTFEIYFLKFYFRIHFWNSLLKFTFWNSLFVKGHCGQKDIHTYIHTGSGSLMSYRTGKYKVQYSRSPIDRSRRWKQSRFKSNFRERNFPSWHPGNEWRPHYGFLHLWLLHQHVGGCGPQLEAGLRTLRHL